VSIHLDMMFVSIGLELAGALKNVYAIAAGASDGLGFENNTRASEQVSRNKCAVCLNRILVLITRFVMIFIMVKQKTHLDIEV